MRWPWHRQPEIRSSNYTDAILTSLLANASGGGAKTALATAALGQSAALYAAALSSCEITGPSTVTRVLDASWRASVASELVRHGQTVYLIDADPARGLALQPVSRWDTYGGADPSSWSYRVERAGPSASSWRTVPAGAVLHLRWITDPARPWAGVGPLQYAADTGSLAGWLDKRIGEESSAPVGSFLPVVRSEVSPDVDFEAGDDPEADPLLALREDVGRAAGRLLLVESQIAAADSPASAPRRDFQTSRFGADPPSALVELRERVVADVAAACGIPRALVTSDTSAGALREAWRQFVATSVDALARKIEAQIADQLGAAVALSSEPLAGRDLLARGATVARLVKAGVSVPDARAAAGI